MKDRDALYHLLQQENEKADKRISEYFMLGFESGLIDNLDKYFVSDMDSYNSLVAKLKAQGIKILRNNAGKHKLKYT